jgi:MscS family membrane protein
LYLLTTPLSRIKIGSENLTSILWFLGIIAVTILLKKPLSKVIAWLGSGIAKRFSDKQHGKQFQALIIQPVELLLQTALFYLAINQLSIFLNQVIFRRLHGRKLMEIRVSDIADQLFLFFIILFITHVLSRIVDFIFYVLIDRAYKTDDKEKEQLYPLVKEVFKIVLWTLGGFWILGSVFNVNIPALITGLGIGGVAIALAAKESVENFFASFTIMTDKPFQIDDSIRLGSLEGKVERIGFRSTKLRNPDGSLFIIPNKKLVNENVENLTERDTRRVKFIMNLRYGIPHETINEIMTKLQAMIIGTVHVKEPVYISIDGFGENALQLAMQYHLPHPLAEQANPELIKQEINLKAYAIVAEYTNAGGIVTEEKATANTDTEEKEEGKESEI